MAPKKGILAKVDRWENTGESRMGEPMGPGE
jgi:hypothetical protein